MDKEMFPVYLFPLTLSLAAPTSSPSSRKKHNTNIQQFHLNSSSSDLCRGGIEDNFPNHSLPQHD